MEMKESQPLMELTEITKQDATRTASGMSRKVFCNCSCSCACVCAWFRDNVVMVASLCAVILGVALGLGLRQINPSYEVITWVGIWGELFLRLLKLIILPLILCCLIVGVASMESGSSGKLGGVTLAYIFLTQLITVIIGLVLAITIKPGAGFDDLPPEGITFQKTSYTDVFADLLRNLFPENIIQSCIQTAYTDVQKTEETTPDLQLNVTSASLDTNVTEKIIITRKLMYRDGMNIMGVVVFGLMLGIATAAAGDAGRPFYKLIVSFNVIIMKIMTAIIWYSPIGITSLIASALMRVDDLEDALQSVGLLIATVVAGCMIHQLIILPVIFAIVCRRNPYSYFYGILPAYLAGIAPPSSAVAMPYLLQICPEKLGIDRRVTQFSVPIEVTLNRDGSALFITVVIIFVGQSYNMPLDIGEQITLALLASILVAAAAVVPSSSIVVIIMLSAAMNIPVEERIGLLMAVEWLLDRVRSGTNIVSHGYGCAIIHQLSKRFLPDESEEAQCEKPNLASVEMEVNGDYTVETSTAQLCLQEQKQSQDDEHRNGTCL